MLPNKYAGEAAATINGRDVKFVLSLGALAQICTAFDTDDNQEIFARLIGKGGMPSFRDLPVIVEACTDGAIDAEVYKSLGPTDLPILYTALRDAIAVAFPAAVEGKKKDDKKPTRTKSRSMNGSSLASGALDIPPKSSGH